MVFILSDEEATILDLLQRGEPQKTIADVLGVDPSTISKKINELKERGVIAVYPAAIVDPTKLVRYIINGYIKLRIEKEEKDWIEWAQILARVSDRIIEVSPLFGEEYDLVIKCYVNSLDEYYDEVVKKIKETIPTLVAMRSEIMFRPQRISFRVPKACMVVASEKTEVK